MRARPMRSLASGVVLGALCAPLALAPGEARAQRPISEIVKAATPAVVFIRALDASGKQIGIGSGFFVRRPGSGFGTLFDAMDGLLVTNYHVISGASSVQVRDGTGTSRTVIGVVAYDRDVDYAVLKVRETLVPTIPVGDVNALQVGDELVVIGNPYGLEFSVSRGIVSQKRRLGARQAEMIQTDAAINSGNSGGPVLNLRAEAVGIATSGVQGAAGVNFAVTIRYIASVLAGVRQVRWTLADLAAIERREIESRFKTVYGPDYLFSVRVPNDWIVRTGTYADSATGPSERTLLAAPVGAVRSEIRGYLSEGIRIELYRPSVGRVYAEDDLERWAKREMDGAIAANAGFSVLSSSRVRLLGEPAMQYTMGGKNGNIPEPEQTTFLMQGNRRHRLVIELVSPVSKLAEYEPLFDMIISSLQVSPTLRTP